MKLVRLGNMQHLIEMNEAVRHASQLPVNEAENLMRHWSNQFVAKQPSLEIFVQQDYADLVWVPDIEKQFSPPKKGRVRKLPRRVKDA